MFNLSEHCSPLDIKDFESFSTMPTGNLFYGLVLRNSFDLEKSAIKPQFNAQKLFTVLKIKRGFSILYLYGAFLKVKPQFNELLASLNLFSQIPSNRHNLRNYNKILKLYNLGCEESYLYFNKDMYPIDSNYSQTIFSNFTQTNFFNPNTSYPFYLTLTAPYILYFTNLKNNLITFNNYLNNITPVSI